MKRFGFLFLILAINLNLRAENYQDSLAKRNYIAKSINSIVNINGKLEEDVWKTADWQGSFVQLEPSQGKVESQKSEFAIVYNEHSIYFGFKCYDTKPDSLVNITTRRDDIDGELVIIQIDSYFDKRTAFSFGLSSAGVRMDQLISNDGNSEDNTWDAIWMAKTTQDESGWYAEVEIPLTQLRFENCSNQIWGLQIGRKIHRLQEVTIWQPSIKEKNGWVSQFGHLVLSDPISPKRAFDVIPYIVSKIETFERIDGDFYRSAGKRFNLNGGLDGKIGITNNLTVDFTINPDFGQVEADPSQVNLTSYETFYEERRPFFLEGNNIFRYSLFMGDGDLGNENLFYSRRIGRRPIYQPETNSNESILMPEFTSIIGAAKITGKTKNGLSVGVLESITSNEYASVYGLNERLEKVEPLTNYLVARGTKDFNNGNTIVGGILTSVNRNIDENSLSFMHKAANTAGIDIVHKWHNKEWEVNFSAYFSAVNGTKEAIDATQNSSVHLFQRPDANYIEYNSERTSLYGNGGKFILGKMGGNLKFMVATSWKSPGLEVNDIGYNRASDEILQILWSGYRLNDPVWIFRNIRANLNIWNIWNYGGEHLNTGGNLNVQTLFKNLMNLAISFNYNSENLSPRELRGGPSLLIPSSYGGWLFYETNESKKFVFSLFYQNITKYLSTAGFNKGYELGFTYRPTKSVNLGINANYSINKDELQYVGIFTYGINKDYLLANIDQHTLGISFRVNWNLTPDLSLQFWGQPFISSGKYTQFKKIIDPRNENYYNRFHILGSSEIQYSQLENIYSVSFTNSEPIYSFTNPNFSVKEFLANLVLRWEYKPGSTFYLVWSQNRSRYDENSYFNVSNNFDELFNKIPNNVFLIKFSYRIGK